MQRISILKPKINKNYLEDCSRIVSMFSANNLEVSLDEAYELWLLVSDSVAAGWLSLEGYSDKELFEITKPFWSVEGSEVAPEEETTDSEHVQEY